MQYKNTKQCAQLLSDIDILQDAVSWYEYLQKANSIFPLDYIKQCLTFFIPVFVSLLFLLFSSNLGQKLVCMFLLRIFKCSLSAIIVSNTYCHIVIDIPFASVHIVCFVQHNLIYVYISNRLIKKLHFQNSKLLDLSLKRQRPLYRCFLHISKQLF